MRDDPQRHRPRFHFSPEHWMNDPIPFFADGRYHVFFQHNPNGAFWGTMHWGHAVSSDLVRWEQLPVALAPDSEADRDGCFTGCIVGGRGLFQILYTGIPQLSPLRQVQCLASSVDLETWKKSADNPVIDRQPEGFGECFRDPCVWAEDGGWRMLIGSEKADGTGGAALLYQSADLKRWEYLHPLCYGEREKTGQDFECPDFFPLGDRHVLLSSRGATHWQTGSYERCLFLPHQTGVTDGAAPYGNHPQTGGENVFYAGKTLLDGQGRRVLFGWLREQRPEAEQRRDGWSGVLSLPRVLSMLPGGILAFSPAPELRALRRSELTLPGRRLDGEFPLCTVGDHGLEILARFAPEADAVSGFVIQSASGDDRLEILHDCARGLLADAELRLAPGEELQLQLFVDRSVIELFANDRICISLRYYPLVPGELTISLFGHASTLLEAKAWELP